MRLTKKLLSFLNRIFDKDPEQFLALRLQYDGGMAWRIENGVLSTTVGGGIGENLSIPLSGYTVAGLVDYLASQPGYTIAYADGSEYSQLSALVLLDGDGDIGASNGDHLYGYTSMLWSYCESAGNELAVAEEQIGEMLKQMSTKTASGEWLDEIGGYYGVPRLPDELDPSYGPRIVAEVLRARSNNIAIENAVAAYTGQDVSVTNADVYGNLPPLYSGAFIHDGSQMHSSVASPIYGLFDVQYGYDLLNGGDIAQFQQTVIGLVNRLRAAGTHMRSILLTGSALADTFDAPPADALSVMTLIQANSTDALTPPADAFGFNGAAYAAADTFAQPAEGLSLLLKRSTSTTVEDVGTAGDIPFTGILTLDGSFTLNGSQTLDGLK